MRRLMLVFVSLFSLSVFSANDKEQANSYDDAWKLKWVQRCRTVLGTGSKTAGFVIHVGDSNTHTAGYGGWFRAGAGVKTTEDNALCTFIKANTALPSTTTDSSSKHGIYLAVTDTVAGGGAFRGMTAASGLRADEFVLGDTNGGPAMPAESDPATARGIVSNTTYTGNLHYETVASAFSDAQAVVLHFGTSETDSPTPPAVNTFINRLTTIINMFESKNTVCVLTTIAPHYDVTKNANVQAYNAAIRTLAQTKELPLIDLNAEILARRPGTSWNGTLLTTNSINLSNSSGGYSASSNPYTPGGDTATHTTGAACENSGFLLRAWLTVQKLKEVRDYVINGADPVPLVKVDPASVTVNEADGTAAVTVKLNFARTSGSASVTLTPTAGTASAASDFTAAPVTVTFAAGETSKTVNIPIINDTVEEPVETFTATLSAPVNCALSTTKTATISINDDDLPPTVELSLAAASILESGGAVAIDLKLSGVSGKTVSVDLATGGGTASAGSDFVDASGTITFAPGETSKTILLKIVDDSTRELDETLSIALSNFTNVKAGAVTSAALTILDNDNRAPVIDSGITFTPAPAASTKPLAFSVGASDPDGDALSYAWNFGDGKSGSGVAPVHVFTAMGTYTVSVTVSDGVASTSTSLIVEVIAALQDDNLDDDLDGFSDEMELAFGTNPLDPKSTPFGGLPPGVQQSFSLPKGSVKIKLDFVDVDNDVITLNGSLPVPAGQSMGGTRIAFSVGDVVKMFQLDANGKGNVKSGGSSFRANVGKGGKLGTQNIRFNIRMKGNFKAHLLDDGMTAQSESTQRQVDVIIIFGMTYFHEKVMLTYSAKNGRGSAK